MTMVSAKLRMKRIKATKYYYPVGNNPMLFSIYKNLEYFMP
jgi:hypothetical protein